MGVENSIVDVLERVAQQLPVLDDVLGQSIRTDYKRWTEIEKQVRVTAPKSADDIVWALDTTELFSRREICAISTTDALSTERRRLVAGLMWGYGTKGLRFPATRVAVGNFLADPGLEGRLLAVRSALAIGDRTEAYGRMKGVKGIRSAFFTKHLYFTGRASDPGGLYPLILDTLVVRSLAQAAGLTKFVRLNSYWPAGNAVSYGHYVDLMHRSARRLGTSAECIEQYLWKPGTGFAAACASVHGDEPSD